MDFLQVMLLTQYLLLHQYAHSTPLAEEREGNLLIKRASLTEEHDNKCAIAGDNVLHSVTELVNEISLSGLNRSVCSTSATQGNLSCTELYHFVNQVLLRLNVTTECCLENGTHCGDDHDHMSSTAEVYGYGFLMILAVSACALLGVLALPLVRKKSGVGQLYKYFYSLMIAMGASALFCDAVLHLIPQAFHLHGHSGEEEAGAGEDQSFIWKGCVIIAGTYFFFLFETILHSRTAHRHTHGVETVTGKIDNKKADTSSVHSNDGLLTDTDTEKRYGGTGKHEGGKEHTESVETEEPQVRVYTAMDTNCFARTVQYLFKMKPLAWLIIFGDAIHNFADGLALGAAIAQSLSLGVSTMIALIFHEIPHELGDFVILLSTGMRWHTALFFSLVSQITGIAAFFVGVAISTTSEDANGWILAVAAGIFLYIALVDLLPGLIHISDKGCVWWGRFAMINLGFTLSFIALLLLAIFEDELNKLISS